MFRSILSLSAIILFSSCSPTAATSDSASPCTSADDQQAQPSNDLTNYIAFTTSFCGYRQWHSFAMADPGPEGNVHIAGPRTEYINKKPPAGSAEFPIGTIIVKEIEVGEIESRSVFAMVKRGGGFNQAGAVGWEWFELKNAADGNVARIVWHGFGPPNGIESYGGDATICNSCHAAAKSNDFVQSANLQLTKF